VRTINYPKEDQVAGPTEAAGCESVVITCIQIVSRLLRNIFERIGAIWCCCPSTNVKLGELRSSKQK
jgi:hypothetical protein